MSYHYCPLINTLLFYKTRFKNGKSYTTWEAVPKDKWHEVPNIDPEILKKANDD